MSLPQDSSPSADPADRILDAAWRCFSHYGFQKTAMEDIAREAGLSRGSVYRRFPDKESLFRAVSEQQTRLFLADVTRRTSKVDGLSAQIALVARMTLDFLRDNPLNAGLARTDPDAFARALSTEGGELLAMSIEVVAPLVQEAIQRGKVRADLDPKRAAEWITRVVFSLISTPSVTFDSEDPEQREAFVREFLVPGLD